MNTIDEILEHYGYNKVCKYCHGTKFITINKYKIIKCNECSNRHRKVNKI